MTVDNCTLPATRYWAPAIAKLAEDGFAQDGFDRQQTWFADRAGDDPTAARLEPPRWPRVFPGL
jgi:hypothetical protein